MDDHMYDDMLSYAKCELIPRFEKEYEEFKILKNCPSYQEIKDLCAALNCVGKYTGYKDVCPMDFACGI